MRSNSQSSDKNYIKSISADTDMPWLKWPLLVLLMVVSISGVMLAVFSIVIHWDSARLYLRKVAPASIPIFDKMAVEIRQEKLPELTELHLNGIMGNLTSNDFDYAQVILNDDFIPVGSEVNGIRILKADMKSIVFEFEGKQHTMRVGESLILEKTPD